MKKNLITAFSLFLCVTAGAQRLGVREEVRADWNKSSGLDCLVDPSLQSPTPVPKGYKAVYISHYGRHGSRYAYTDQAYTILLNMLSEGRKQGNLTPKGEALLNELEPFWDYVKYRVGDLTEIGWNQHQEIARTMVTAFPTVFGKGSEVDACSSASVRAIMSMSSACTAISRLSPETKVYEHQGIMDIQATRPNQGANPFKYQGPEEVFPYPESSERFFLRHFPNYKDVLARLFKNPDSALGQRNPYDVFFHLYMFVAGMNSLPQDVRLDVKDFFTVEEFATLWETDNYERFREYHAYRTPCSSIVDDMVEKASEMLAAGKRGAHLRYGHDHVVMALELIMDLDGFDRAPADPDDLVYWFQTFRSPMGANIQYVFFQPRKGRKGDTLVKVLLNGEEAHLGDLEGFPYYRWEDVKAYLAERTGQFVYRPEEKGWTVTEVEPGLKYRRFEGAVGGGSDVRIVYEGKGKSVDELRTFYATSTAPNIFSSAPMLIDDYQPVGESFAGFQNDVSRYAMNMDGGGSSTLCVAGEGDPKTHVVNRPTDSKDERLVGSHFVLIHE